MKRINTDQTEQLGSLILFVFGRARQNVYLSRFALYDQFQWCQNGECVDSNDAPDADGKYFLLLPILI